LFFLLLFFATTYLSDKTSKEASFKDIFIAL
jgi:hypothetical protein